MQTRISLSAINKWSQFGVFPSAPTTYFKVCFFLHNNKNGHTHFWPHFHLTPMSIHSQVSVNFFQATLWFLWPFFLFRVVNNFLIESVYFITRIVCDLHHSLFGCRSSVAKTKNSQININRPNEGWWTNVWVCGKWKMEIAEFMEPKLRKWLSMQLFDQSQMSRSQNKIIIKIWMIFFAVILLVLLLLFFAVDIYARYHLLKIEILWLNGLAREILWKTHFWNRKKKPKIIWNRNFRYWIRFKMKSK